MNENNDAPFVEKPKRNHDSKKNKGGDKWSQKAKKQHKRRERELHEEDLDDELSDWG